LNKQLLNPRNIIWLIPPAYLLHLLDEYFLGVGLPDWLSDLFKTNLSKSDFIIINSIGLTATFVIVILNSLNKVNEFLIVALGSLFFLNGLIHLLASVLTVTYSPGTISGVILYIPLGVLIFRKILPLLPEQQRPLSIVTGIIAHVIISLIAFSI
jgi:Protein of unknown function with HXXEE motif